MLTSRILCVRIGFDAGDSQLPDCVKARMTFKRLTATVESKRRTIKPMHSKLRILINRSSILIYINAQVGIAREFHFKFNENV